MLAVILKILSILGIILLILLVILLVALLLLLFMPIVYRINVEKETEALKLNARMRWLFGLVRGGYAYPEPGRVVVKVLWLTVFDSGTEKKTTPNAASANTTDAASQGLEETATKVDESAEKNINIPDDNAQSDTTDEKKSIFEKIKYTIEQIYDKIKHVLENIFFYKELIQDEETKLLISHVCKRLGKILRNIRPGKLKADVIFGTGSPDTTGYAYGIYGMFSPMLGKDVFVTPDFTQKILEGKLYASGHITIFTLLVNLLAVLLDKRLNLLKQRLNAHDRKSNKKT